jgi:dipeptidyl aminopeptidase/acylaminoacyl peptidase
VWTCALDGEPTRLTEGELDHADVRWSPDGKTLVFACAGHPTRGDDLRADVWACAADGSGRRALTGGSVSASQPWFTPDGTAVVFTSGDLGEDGLRGAVRNVGLWSVPAAGGAATRLSDEETHTLTGAIEATAHGVLALAEHRGAVRLLRFGYAGGPPEVLVDGERQVFAATTAGDGLVFAAGDATSHGELVFRAADGTERTLTDFGAGYRAATTVYPLRELEATAPDGTPVHGWLVRPDGDGPHPLLLMIHGGPYTQYGWQLFDEAQVLASAGYAVLLTNPRGSSGYGQAHGRAVIGDVGAVSTADLMAALDHALAENVDLDPARVGVLGGSHGGFMTTWLAAHEGHRFKAAVSERAVNAIDSFEGSSDIGWFFADNLYGTDPEARRRQSPLTHADRIDVPLLIIHSEQDWRCPLEQAQRLYVSLKRRGAAVEMLVFPGEGHELSRSGRLSHRMARFEAILEWFSRWV